MKFYEPSEDVSRSDKNGHIIESVKRWTAGRLMERAANTRVAEVGGGTAGAEVFDNEKNGCQEMSVRRGAR